MNDVTIAQNTLKISIRDWEKMRENVNSGMDALEAYKTKPKCALCVVYAPDEGDENCTGCPVMEKTRKEDCVGTPFPDYFYLITTSNAHTKEEVLKAIDAEIDFLKGLVNDE